MADWYRQKSWSKTEEEYFFSKLARARKDGRAQYLKIQAIELVYTKDEKLLDVAESLIAKLFLEYPDDKFNKLNALVTLGDIYRLRKNYDEAISYYKQAIDFELIFRHESRAYFDYAELVIKHGKYDLYDLVEHLLLKKIPGELFPVLKYKGYSMLSIINRHKHNMEQAALFEALADKYANEETSGLRYHKYLGIVIERDSELDKMMSGK